MPHFKSTAKFFTAKLNSSRGVCTWETGNPRYPRCRGRIPSPLRKSLEKARSRSLLVCREKEKKRKKNMKSTIQKRLTYPDTVQSAWLRPLEKGGSTSKQTLVLFICGMKANGSTTGCLDIRDMIIAAVCINKRCNSTRFQPNSGQYGRHSLVHAVVWLSYDEQDYNCSDPHSNTVSGTTMLWLIHKRTCWLLPNQLCENHILNHLFVDI